MNMVAQVQAKPAPTPSFTPVRTNLLQRKCACGDTPGPDGECAECRKQRVSVQRYAVNQSEPALAPPIVHEALHSPGQPLDPSTRTFMEPRFGHDFSKVQVHANARADESARAVNAPSFSMKSGVEQAIPEVDNLNQKSNMKRASQGSTTMVEHHRHHFSATIRRVDNPPFLHIKGNEAPGEKPETKPRFSALHNDAMPGNDKQTAPIDFASLLAQTTVPAPAEAISEPEEGETVRLPDIVLAPTADIEQTDAVASTLAYNGTITQTGPEPADAFGETLPYTHAISGISVTRVAGSYNVTATVDNPITFQVRTSTGPDGQLDIASDSDPDITQASYPTVASDLTPDMSDRGGAPPRNNFWARDLCIRHERFHADEDVVHGGSGVTLAQNWLNTQTAASVAGVNALLAQVPARVAATVSAAMAFPGREIRAYGDGVPLYRARANAIKTKGDAGGYAPSSAPTGPSRGAKTAIGVGGGALVGAGIGAVAGGPVGAAVGAGIGALVGGIGSLFF